MARRWTGCALGLALVLWPAKVPAQQGFRPPVVEWAADGKVLIAASNLLARFDLDSDREELLDASGSTFALSPDGQRLALGGPNRLELRTYPGFERQATLSLPEGTEITALAWSPDGATLAAGTQAGHTLLSEVSSRELWADLGVEPASRVERLRFAADSARLLAAYEDGRAVLWDIVAREEVHRFSPARNLRGELEGETAVVALGPDGRRLLANQVRDENAEFVLLDAQGGVAWRRAGYGLDFTPDGGGVLALAPPFRIAALYRTADAEALRIFEPPESVTTLYLVRLSPDGKFLLGVGEDPLGQVLILWDFLTARVLKTRR